MDFIDSSLFDYAVKHSQQEPQLLQELTRETHLKVLQPRMLSGPLQGRFLSLISKLISPKSILEIGTFTGYATLCLAEGLSKNGRIDTIDKNEELYDFQRKYFNLSCWGNQIHQHLGNAMEIIPELNESYDIVFLDADKKNYLNYLDLVKNKIRPGGLLLSDNVLWSGKVLNTTEPKDEDTRVLKLFNKTLGNSNEFETVLLPLRDGLTVSRKC